MYYYKVVNLIIHKITITLSFICFQNNTVNYIGYAKVDSACSIFCLWGSYNLSLSTLLSLCTNNNILILGQFNIFYFDIYSKY